MRKLTSALILGMTIGTLILSGCSLSSNLGSGQESDTVVVSQSNEISL